jgi:hypothetical protein
VSDEHGWYPDPAGVHHQRYWSGDAWTARVADAYGVIAVHHLDGDHAPPGGGPVPEAAMPARSAPVLSLVGGGSPATPEVLPPPPEPPPPLSELAPLPPPPAPPPPPVASPLSPPVAPAPVPSAVARPPRAAGWYSDPTGIHCDRSWDGHAWSAVVVDRNRVVIEHAIRDSYAGPAAVVTSELSASSMRDIDVIAAARALGGTADGWQIDPAGPFRERYVLDGRPSEVVRTARCRVG